MMFSTLFDDIGTLLIVLAVIAAITGALLAKVREGNKRAVEGFFFYKKAFLTDNEKEFYTRLKQAVPELDVICQVSMGAIMNGRHVSGNNLRARAKFDRKIIDYVLLDGNGDILLLIELDDRTHEKKKDALRDKITGEAGYKTLRVESKNKPSVKELRAAIGSAIGT